MSQTRNGWEIRVVAGAGFTSLCQAFGGNDIRLGENGPLEFSAWSPHADELEDPAAAATRIHSLQVFLNGALRINAVSHHIHPIIFREFHADGRRHRVAAEILEEYPFSTNADIDADLTGFRDPTRHLSSNLLFHAKNHEPIRVILAITGLISTRSTTGRIFSWNALYKLLDTVKHYSNEFGWGMDEFANKTAIKSFTGACNNMSVIGLNARHGVTKGGIPKKCVATFDEASAIIIPMASSFCGKYLNEKT